MGYLYIECAVVYNRMKPGASAVAGARRLFGGACSDWPSLFDFPAWWHSTQHLVSLGLLLALFVLHIRVAGAIQSHASLNILVLVPMYDCLITSPWTIDTMVIVVQ